MNQELSVSHFTGVGVTANSDHRFSRTISTETDHTRVVSTLASPEGRASSDRHLVFDTDTEAAKPRTESVNFNQLTQPLYVFLAYPFLYVDLCGLGWALQIQSLELSSAASTHVVASLSGPFLLLVLVFWDGIMPTNLLEN